MPPLPSARPTLYIGIDPGASGGLACLTPNTIQSGGMPETERDVYDWFRQFKEPGNTTPALNVLDNPVFAVIEKVGGYIQGNKLPGSAMFNFGRSYGGLRMALIAAGIPFEEATPQRWQKALGIPSRKKDESKGQFKNRLKAKASELFPSVKVTLAIADALLIAEYCRRKRTGTL